MNPSPAPPILRGANGEVLEMASPQRGPLYLTRSKQEGVVIWASQNPRDAPELMSPPTAAKIKQELDASKLRLAAMLQTTLVQWAAIENSLPEVRALALHGPFSCRIRFHVQYQCQSKDTPATILKAHTTCGCSKKVP